MAPSTTEPPPAAGPLGLYLHVPYCAEKCPYCTFFLTTNLSTVARFLGALEREVELWAAALPEGERRADTAFFGGGTPSLLDGGQIGRLLDKLRDRLQLSGDAEVTLETNPETVTPAAAEAWLGAGVTRFSLGVQSLRAAELRLLGRTHSAAEAETAARTLRAAGARDLSLDLIAGLPGQTPARWAETLDRTLAWEADHLSVYLLELDKPTPLGHAIRRGELPAPDPAAQADIYAHARERLTAHGYRQYEISNFARPGRESLHNAKYWTGAPYLGLGPAAHGYRAGERLANPPRFHGYLRALESGTLPVVVQEPFVPERRLEEALFLGLRRVEGVDLEALARRYGIPVRDRYREALASLVADGLCRQQQTRLTLTPTGQLQANEVSLRFLS